MMLVVVILLAAVVGFQAVVIANSGARAQRRQDSAVALERARQDLLLNRLATRTLPEYVAATAALNESRQQPSPAPRREYLYDATGLVQSIEYPDDDENDD